MTAVIKNQSLLNLIRKTHGFVENTDIEKHRQSQDYFGVLLANGKDTVITETDVSGTKCEWVAVNKAHLRKNIILYFHGGGFSTGSSIYARTLTTKLALATCMDVFCFDYRLAPENPYPAAAEDAMKIWNYLLLQGYGASNIMVAGDSAGGNLVLSLLLRLKKEERMLPGSLTLLSPWTDMTASGKSYQTKGEADPVLNEAYIRQMVGHYTAEDVSDLCNPYLSPVFGDFHGFPPTYIQVGDQEILLSDASRLYKKMLKDGVYVKLDVFRGMWHVFQMSPFKTAYEAITQIANFIFYNCR